MNINELSKRAHDHAKKNGFFGDTPGLAIGDKIREECDEYDEAFSKGRDCDIPDGVLMNIHEDLTGGAFKSAAKSLFEGHVKNTIPDELVDGILVNMSGLIELGYDPEAHILAKLAYNSVRDDHVEVEG